MSFFIDETNFLSDVYAILNSPNYEIRDKIESKVRAILPSKNIINVKGSDIKVELFHSDITDAQLEEIEKVINDTFKLCQEYKIAPSNADFNFRMFLFEDDGQYDNVRKVYTEIEEDISSELGVTITKANTPFALSDVLIRPLSSSDSPDQINYLTLSHEFVHCMQNMAKHKDASLSKLIIEGSAVGISCELLDENGQNAQCQQRIMDGIKTAFANNVTPSFIHDSKSIYQSNSLITEDDNYSVGLVMFNFLQDKHPKIIGKIYEYYSTGDTAKQYSVSKKTPCIDSEFRYWLLDTISKKVHLQDKTNFDLAEEMRRDIEEHSCTQNPEFRNIVDKFSKMYKGTHETLDWVEQTLEQIDFI